MNTELEKTNEQSRSEESDQALGRMANLAVLDEDHVERIKLEPGRSYEINPDSKISKEAVLRDIHDKSKLTNPAKNVLNADNVIGIIHADDQRFWLADMRNYVDFKEARVPFLLVQPESFDAESSQRKRNPNAWTKGIRPGETLVFGRTHDYGERFDYSAFVSRDHFSIKCDEDGKLSIEDLYSRNGTELFVNQVDSEDELDKDKMSKWFYTPHLIENHVIHRRDDGKAYITIRNHEFPCLDRDVTSFNGHIDVGLVNGRGGDIYIDGESVEILVAYDTLKKKLDSDSIKPSIFDILKTVKTTVADILKYSIDGEERVIRDSSREYDNGNRSLLKLSDFVYHKVGVCREQALLSACLLEKLKNDGYISGEIHVERNMNNDNINGHEWATFRPEGSENIYVVDPAQHYMGNKENANNWNYNRPSQK